VLDIAVDIRKNSPTFGKWEGVILSEENKHMLFVPKGFAHGFWVLSETVDFLYKVSNFYSKAHDRGILWDDPDIGIEWGVEFPILSKKDKQNRRLNDVPEEELF
jgi:dTDP-4-dehydrorhamnose 3,5-epimerase